jgi:hypothetical protein
MHLPQLVLLFPLNHLCVDLGPVLLFVQQLDVALRLYRGYHFYYHQMHLFLETCRQVLPIDIYILNFYRSSSSIRLNI